MKYFTIIPAIAIIIIVLTSSFTSKTPVGQVYIPQDEIVINFVAE